MWRTVLVLAFVFALIFACSQSDGWLGADRGPAGGQTTVFTATSNAFSFPAANLSPEALDLHLKGDFQFESVYVKSPAPVNAGLGPLFNTTSCISCHPKDGRASFPDPVNKRSGFLIRTSIPGQDQEGGPQPVPGFGLQIQNHAVYGNQPEAGYAVRFTEREEVLADGTVVSLRKPEFFLVDPYKPLPENLLLSARMGTPMFGLGLLEFIPEADILALADPDDLDGDGISGRANYVWDPLTQSKQLGRFGWKANVSNLETQTAIAFLEDMGITSPVFPYEHLSRGDHGDLQYEELDRGRAPELSQEILDLVVFYNRTLAVPAARNQSDKEVRKGAAVFHAIGCASCHVPQQRTLEAPIHELANQHFFPFTDMLLHDMGEGLADHRPDYEASGREWKTRPLWGIGLTQVVNGHTHFLHDGRARNLTEAIMWHGGEAERSKNDFRALSTEKRNQLLAFLRSL